MTDTNLSTAAKETLVLLFLNGPQTLKDLPCFDAYQELVKAGLANVVPQADKAYGLNRDGLDRAVGLNNVNKLAELVGPIIDQAFTAAVAEEKSSHGTLVSMEDHIMLALSDIDPDGDYTANVTASIGKNFKFTTSVRNMRTNVEHTQENIVGEPAVEPEKPKLNMAQRSNVAITATKIIRDALSDKYLETEFLGADVAINAIGAAIIEKIAAELPGHMCNVDVTISETLVATARVDIPGVTTVRLRATREPIKQETADAV